MYFVEAVLYTVLGLLIVIALAILVGVTVLFPLAGAIAFGAVAALFGVAGIIYWLGNR